MKAHQELFSRVQIFGKFQVFQNLSRHRVTSITSNESNDNET